MYHYDPSNPPNAIRYSNTRKKTDRQKTLNNNSKPNANKESYTNSNFTKIKNNGESESDPTILIDNKYSNTNPSTNNSVEIVESPCDDDEKEENDENSTQNVDSYVESDDGCKTKEEIHENEC